MEALFEALQTLLKCKDNRVMSKNLKHQNANWSYMPTHIPILHLENTYLVQTFINLNNFCCIKWPI